MLAGTGELHILVSIVSPMGFMTHLHLLSMRFVLSEKLKWVKDLETPAYSRPVDLAALH